MHLCVLCDSQKGECFPKQQMVFPMGMQCEVCGSHGGNYEECYLPEGYEFWS
jgi:hypothetical protein